MYRWSHTFWKSIIISIVFCLGSSSLSAYRLIYKEQLYELYHVHLYQHPTRIAENIYYLEQVLRADFANPLYALARITNKTEWKWYRELFMMHINIKLIELYLRWGSKYMKFEAYFYNAPWKRQNLESLEKAEQLFRFAKVYWEEALEYSDQASGTRFIHLNDIQNWEDEHFRIQKGDLDYDTIINTHLEKVKRVREAFEAMDASTY